MLRAYEAYLIKKGTVKPQSVPYYLKWVSDYYSSLNEPLPNRPGVDQKKQFLSEMAKRREDWQVKEANTALRLYDYVLCENRPMPVAEITSDDEKWKLLKGGEAKEAPWPLHSNKESLTFP